MGRYDPPRELIDRLRAERNKKALKQVQLLQGALNKQQLELVPDMADVWDAVADGRLDSDTALGYIRGETPEGLDRLARPRLPIDADEAEAIDNPREEAVESAPAKKASVQMMLTNKMKQDLADLGWTPETISKMSPEIAQQVIERKLRMPTSEKASEGAAKKLLGKGAREASGKSASLKNATGVEGQAAGGETYKKQIDSGVPTPEEELIAKEAKEAVAATAAKVGGEAEVISLLQEKLAPHIGPEGAARINTLDDLEKLVMHATDYTANKPRSAAAQSLASTLEYIRKNGEKVATKELDPKVFAANISGTFTRANSVELTLLKSALKDDVLPQADPTDVAQLEELTKIVSPGKPTAQPAAQPGGKVVGNLKPSEQFAVPANLEEALAQEQLSNEQWRLRSQAQGNSTATRPPNMRGTVEDTTGLGRGPRKAPQFPLAKIGGKSYQTVGGSQVEPEAPRITPTAPPVEEVAAVKPPGSLGKFFELIKDLAKSEGEAASQMGKTVFGRGASLGARASTAIKWAGGTGLGGFLTSMLIGKAGEAGKTIMSANAASDMVPSVDDIVNRARLQQMQEERARNALGSNPELMKQLRQQLEGRKMMATNQLPGEISIGGDPTDGPFTDPEALVTRLASGM